MEDVDREDALDQDGTNQNNDDRDAVIRNRKERIDRFKAQLSMALCSLLATTNPSRVLVIANKFCTDDDNFMKMLAGNGVAVVDVGVGYRHWPPVLKGEYPRLTCCLFTFNKLLIWRLGEILPEGEDTPIVWYDSDILWKKNATVGLIEKYRDAYDGNGVVAAQWPAEFMKGDVVLNSGVMLLRPSTEVFLRLETSWAHGEYKLVNAEKTATGDQEVISSLCGSDGGGCGGPWIRLDVCDNYRRYEFQKHCNESEVLLWHPNPRWRRKVVDFKSSRFVESMERGRCRPKRKKKKKTR